MITSYATSPVYCFLRTRWSGDIPLRQLFWWDTLAIATLINAFVAVFSMILLAKGITGSGVWLLLQFTLLPYNVFLVMAVLRHGQSIIAIRMATMAWFGLTLVT